jgi:hypothetical protein
MKLVDLHVYLWGNLESFSNKDNYLVINVWRGFSLEALRANIFFSTFGSTILTIATTYALVIRFSLSKHTH